MQDNLKSVAAKQMLLYNTYDPDHVLLNEFYIDLNGLNGDGYPHQSYNVSVSNGNFQATYGMPHVGRHLLTLKVNDNLIHSENAVAWDCFTGSKITDITMRRYGDIFPNPLKNIWYEVAIIFNPAYQPTWSALDLYDANDLTKRPEHDSWGNLKEPYISKFDDYLVQEEPLQHHELSELTRNTIMDWLDKDLNVNINYNSPEGGTINPDIYQFKILHPITITVPTKTGNINGKLITYFFQQWEDGSTENPRTFFPGNNGSYTAIMKGTQLSDNQNTYSNNSQRKIVKTPDGNLYNTYESLGYVWLERSTNGGSTWDILNNGKPLGNTLGKSPSMDYSPSGNLIVITYLENVDGDNYKLEYAVYNPSGGNFRYGEVEFLGNPMAPYFGEDAQAVVAWNGNSKALFVLKFNNDIYYVLCQLTATTTDWIEISKGSFGSGEDINKLTLYATKINAGTQRQYFHLAYQKNNRDIKYRNIFWSTHEGMNVGEEVPVSDGTGYSVHYNPSITGTDNVRGEERYEYIRLAWVGYRNSQPDIPPQCAVSDGETSVIYKFKSPFSGWFDTPNVYGNNVNSVNVNKGTEIIYDFEPFAIAWSEGVNCNYPNKYVRSYSLDVIRTLSTTGDEVQINNSNDFNNMYVNSFHRTSPPYYFNLSENLSGGMQKIESLTIQQGREGVVTKDSVDFYYGIGDINIDGENVNFTEMPDTIEINDLQTMNEYLLSEPFNVTGNSVLAYSVVYGITDSAKTVNALSDSSQISFRVELVDNQSGELLGVFDEVTYNSENIFQYERMGYEVDLAGIGDRTLRFRLVAGTTAECEYSISRRYSDSEIINKRGTKQIKYTGSLAVTEYALEQNYPNPFNPVTTIKYQIPKSGNVVLKVYDVTGAEVATLVDAFQNEGRFEVNFNANKLASGVYIYRLQANDFISVKKMVLLK